MQPLTLSTWGYWGWGHATRQLIEAVDAVEAARGYGPPLFVDIRLSRSVRAPGFSGRAFEDAVGSSRYRWLPDLGNLAVQDGGDDAIRIKNPAAAETLLDIAEGAARDNRRVMFFCACEFPGVEGQDECCHRTTVARLVLEAARRKNLAARVVEWPGGEPPSNGFVLELAEPAFEKVRRGAVWIPLEEPVPLVEVAGLPWGTVTFVQCRGKGPEWYFRLLAGPARYSKAGWQLPVCEDIDLESSSEEILDQVREFREEWGFVSRGVGLDETARAAESDARARTEVKGIDSRPRAMKRRMTRGSMGDFMKPLQPSPTLAAIVGSERQVRTELTSKIWNYIIEHDLQDKANKRLINCDDKLRAVTGKDQVSMFELTKFVSEHLEVPGGEATGEG